jgi:hypothetical protein
MLLKASVPDWMLFVFDYTNPDGQARRYRYDWHQIAWKLLVALQVENWRLLKPACRAGGCYSP